MIIFSDGTKIKEAGRAPVNVNDTRLFIGQQGEMSIDMHFPGAVPTHSDLALAATQALTEFQIENPGIDVKYAQVSKDSPYCLTFQFEAKTNPALWVLVGSALAAVLAFVVKNAFGIAIVTFLAVTGYALYKRLTPVHQCPICGEKFESYETLVAHMSHYHPGAPIPDRPSSIWPDWPEYPSLVPFLIIGGVAIGAAILIPNLIRRK